MRGLRISLSLTKNFFLVLDLNLHLCILSEQSANNLILLMHDLRDCLNSLSKVDHLLFFIRQMIFD